MHSTEVGRLGESYIMSAFIKMGAEVYLPFGGNTTYDMIVVNDGSYYTVECKTASVRNKAGGYTVQIKSVRSNKTQNVIKPFDPSKVDILAIYLVPDDQVFFIETKEFKFNSLNAVTINKKDIENMKSGLDVSVDVE